MSTFTPMHKVIPPAKGFEWAVEHFEVTEEQSRMTTINMHSWDDFVPPGKYVKLVRGTPRPVTVMSDTEAEQRTNRGVVRHAQGDVLIAGLGLGMVLVPVCTKPEVRHVTVLELHGEVRKLVEKPLLKYLGPAALKLTIIDADVFKWQPPKEQRWDCIYFDIWTSQSTDTLQEIATLKRRFARRKKAGGWMGAWREGELRYARARERREGW